MKKLFLLLTFVANISMAMVDRVGESVNYVLNSSRSTWLIRSGSATAKVLEYRASSEYGPGYVVKVNYDLSVLLRGRQHGEIGLFVPEKVMMPDFMPNLMNDHPMSLGSFMLDYEGQANASDSAGNMYNKCSMIRMYDINHLYRPSDFTKEEATVLWFNHQGNISAINDLEIKMKVHGQVPVLGAVQIDISGASDAGISFEAGMDAVMAPR